MNATKELMVKTIESQPDDSTYDEILRELAFARMLEKGIADSDAGHTISNQEMKQKIESWQK
jgi:predicted transcriptional regulator